MVFVPQRQPGCCSGDITAKNPDAIYHRAGSRKPVYPKPVIDTIHSLDPEASAKWVPLNKSFTTLTKIILKAASERFGMVNIAVTMRCVMLQGYCHLVLVNDDHDIQIAALGRVEEFIISTEMPMTPICERLNVAEAISVPLDFQPHPGFKPQRLGYLVARVGNTATISNADRRDAGVADAIANLAIVSEEIIAVIRRYQMRYRAIHVYGDQCYWVGNSIALRQLGQRIALLARSSLPVVIRGNKGSGKIIAARALHSERRADMVPFIESDCGSWKPGTASDILHALTIYARGGTLFLRNIDKLTAANLQALQRYCLVKSADTAEREAGAEVDLVFSLGERDGQLRHGLTQWLELNSAELRLPDLNERNEDMRDLARFFIYEYAIDQYFDFSEAAWQMLERQVWSGNVNELKSVIQQLTAVIETPLVDATLLQSWLPR